VKQGHAPMDNTSDSQPDIHAHPLQMGATPHAGCSPALPAPT